MDWPILSQAILVMLGFLGALAVLGAIIVLAAQRHSRRAIDNPESPREPEPPPEEGGGS